MLRAYENDVVASDVDIPFRHRVDVDCQNFRVRESSSCVNGPIADKGPRRSFQIGKESGVSLSLTKHQSRTCDKAEA